MEKIFKHQNAGNMMKKGILFLMLLLIPLASAKIQYYQEKTLYGNNSVYNYNVIVLNAFVDYDKNAEDVADYVKKGNPFEFYVEYRYFLSKWNSQNSSRNVSYCNLTAYLLPSNASLPSSVIFTKKFYPNETDSDVSSNKYFFQINDGEAVRISGQCLFSSYYSLNPLYDLDMPLDFQIATPSWNCKACQFYEWAKQQITVAKTLTLDDRTSSNINYIYRIIVINLEIFLVLFWIFLFIVFYLAISLLFMGMYWVYNYLRSFAR